MCLGDLIHAFRQDLAILYDDTGKRASSCLDIRQC